MSHSLVLLEILADGRPHTVPDLMELSGLTDLQVMGGMRVLRKTKSMRSLSLPYQITEAGRDWLAERQERASRVSVKVVPPPKPRGRPPLPLDERIARDMKRRRQLVEVRRKKREQERLKARNAKQAEADRARIAAAATETVAQARADRTPLEMAWGAPA